VQLHINSTDSAAAILTLESVRTLSSYPSKGTATPRRSASSSICSIAVRRLPDSMVTTTSSSPLVVLTPERATFRTTRLIQARQLLVRATRHSPRHKHMAPEPRFPLTNMGPTLRSRCLRERNQLTILTLTTPRRRSDTWVRSLGHKTTSRHLEQLGVKERQFPRCERIHLSALVTSCPDLAGNADSIEKQRDPLPQVAAKTNQGSMAFMRTSEDLSTLPIR